MPVVIGAALEAAVVGAWDDEDDDEHPTSTAVAATQTNRTTRFLTGRD
ncbi:MAG TPA: hypothetical protein VL119_11060 [Acidimicrobiia bacterium]|nr:hypothetical protein [Acidimicrobiia bacterium]